MRADFLVGFDINNVDRCMDGVEDGFLNSVRWGHVLVGDTGVTGRCTELRRIINWLPVTDNLDKKFTPESRSEHLRHDKHVGSQR